MANDPKHLRANVPMSTIEKNKDALILLIEDDKFLRDLIAQKIMQEGYPVAEAADGEQGISILESKRPRLALLDLVLPGIDGFEVLLRMSKNKAITGTPVIVLSNLGTREDIDRALGLGAKDFLVKANFTPAEIVAKVKKVLQESYL